MYRRIEPSSNPPENFEIPVESKLSPDNRWIIMSNLIPWQEFEEEYASLFSEQMGAPAKSFRLALGALIIKERLGVSDRETVEQIRENPYLQYFIGLKTYSNEAPFEASMLVHFRQRISGDLVNQINQRMVRKIEETLPHPEEEKKTEKEQEEEEINEPKNQGKLIVDATCAPADISYPKDLEILNKAREETEEIIDCLYEPIQEQLDKKPKTYREKARKDYLEIAKRRKPSAKQRRKALKKQLQFLKRNLAHIDKLIEAGANLTWLSKRQYKILLVVAEVYRQQREMYEERKRSIPDRIVSLTQPHIRPIVRGKAGKPVEFGAKISASCVNGYVFIHRISWNNFNEGGDLKAQIEEYKNEMGFYPESVQADKIYRTRENRAYCQERGIRISGPPLGRPKINISIEEKKQTRKDEGIRNTIEGKFGQGKRRFSLGRVMTKLPNTSQTSMAITFLVINLDRLLRQVLGLFFVNFHSRTIFLLFWGIKINKSYAYPSYDNKNLSC